MRETRAFLASGVMLVAATMLVLDRSALALDPADPIRLVCKTSSSVKLAITNQPVSNPGFGLDTATAWAIHFSKGTAAAKSDGSGLKPGQCSWVTRSMTATEPACVAYRFQDKQARKYSIPKALWLQPDGKLSGSADFAYTVSELATFVGLNRSEGKRFSMVALPPPTAGSCLNMTGSNEFPLITLIDK